MLDENLFIIVVLFQPTQQQLIDLFQLSRLYNIIVVDNSGDETVPAEQQSSFVEYLPLRNNVGIAKAQNIGIAKCLHYNASFVLFLDQDSLVENYFPLNLLNHFIELRKQFPKVIAIGPSLVDVTRNEIYDTGNLVNIRDSYYRTTTLISSGMLVPVVAFEDIGYFDERLFIDYVDHDWCWRANSKGYICCMDMSIKIKHKVGKKSIKFFGLPFIISSPNRYYFQYRNSIWLQKRNYVPFSWKIKIFVKNTIGLLLYPLCSNNNPFAIISYIFKGVFAGLFVK